MSCFVISACLNLVQVKDSRQHYLNYLSVPIRISSVQITLGAPINNLLINSLAMDAQSQHAELLNQITKGMQEMHTMLLRKFENPKAEYNATLMMDLIAYR